MENQHRKIKGYRELSQEEIDLMNRIKVAGSALLDLQFELIVLLKQQESDKVDAANQGRIIEDGGVAEEELARFSLAEPLRWASIGKTDVQTGIMALVRAVAQPAGC